MWSDADWCGDAEHTKSTLGMLLELIDRNAGRRWLLSWAVRRHGATSSSTAETETVAETVAVSFCTKHEGFLCRFSLTRFWPTAAARLR